MNTDCLYFLKKKIEKSHDFVDNKKSGLQLLSYQHVGSLMFFPNQECIVILLFLAAKGHCLFNFYSLFVFF